ncbi:hypothetical protein JTE90_019395 [Oedothorax gibbosus]|uniref:Uncharacterized protein n=1 Tax=Oedothorax gibbosus TaxID=931172 RepID=A0AAV6TIH5_9ARAC|nr:hypothetical protein JTE90_019395 [Oedothorax gibbosus]
MTSTGRRRSARISDSPFLAGGAHGGHPPRSPCGSGGVFLKAHTLGDPKDGELLARQDEARGNSVEVRSGLTCKSIVRTYMGLAAP